MNIPKIIHKVILVDGFELPNLPEGMAKAVDTWRNMNPGYAMKMYSGKDCQRYILEHFDQKTLDCFNKIKPYAYKCDLFRYLLLYNEGGWYSDLRQVCMAPLDSLNQSGHEFYTSVDCPPNERGMYTAFIGSVANHPILKKTIEHVCWNIEHEHYGLDCLQVSSPGAFMFGSIDYVRRYPEKCMIGRHIQDRDGSEYVAIGKQVILKCKYNNAKGADNSDIKGGNDYGAMWRSWDVYSSG